MPQEQQLDLRRRSVNADTLGRYYTPASVCGALVAAIPGTQPKLVVELGAGQGALALAASQRWARAKYITVDSDRSATTVLSGLNPRATHTHHVHDALDDALADRIGIRLETVDVGLCNPPYVRPRWRASFGRILEDAGLSGALQSVHDAGADLLFVAQNLRLLRPNGKLGLILPDGLITGEKYRGVRAALLKQHLLEQVVQLPSRAFSGTEAQTYLLILSKRGGETQSVALSKMKVNGELSESICVPADIARKRLDYAFHSAVSIQHRQREALVGRTVGDLVSEIFRGTVSSSQIGRVGLPVFHLGDFPILRTNKPDLLVPQRFLFAAKMQNATKTAYKYAAAGDILVARIGRNLHEKICVVPRGRCAISDCIFALRPATGMRDQLLTFLLSSNGRKALAAASHGVGAKYLTRQDVMTIAL